MRTSYLTTGVVLPQDATTPLILAAASGHVDCVKELLEQGADPRARRVVSTRVDPDQFTHCLQQTPIDIYTSLNTVILGSGPAHGMVHYCCGQRILWWSQSMPKMNLKYLQGTCEVVSESSQTVIVVTDSVKEDKRGGQGLSSASQLHQSATWHCNVTLTLTYRSQLRVHLWSVNQRATEAEYSPLSGYD
jgi:ankyrin repeat protein